MNKPANSLYIKSTYKDNPFLKQEYIDALEEMRVRNPQKYRIYGLGQWGVNSDLLVFKNWRVEDFDEFELAKLGYEQRNGLDLGWIDPSACARTFYDRANKRIYVFAEVYETGLQLDELSNRLSTIGLTRHDKIYCDSAEPRSIDFLKNRGFYAVPCIKGRDSVKARVLFLQNNEIIVKPTCKNMIKELSNFSYIQKDGKITEDMTHEYSHLCCDALGYGYSDIYTANRIQVLDKRILGL